MLTFESSVLTTEVLQQESRFVVKFSHVTGSMLAYGRDVFNWFKKRQFGSPYNLLALASSKNRTIRGTHSGHKTHTLEYICSSVVFTLFQNVFSKAFILWLISEINVSLLLCAFSFTYSDACCYTIHICEFLFLFDLLSPMGSTHLRLSLTLAKIRLHTNGVKIRIWGMFLCNIALHYAYCLKDYSIVTEELIVVALLQRHILYPLEWKNIETF